MSNRSVKWGILASGNIAKKFAQGLAVLDNAELIAVGSRSLERAKSFATQYAVPNAFGSYEELVQHPDIEAIYVASPHPQHLAHTLLCLDHGKAVICEKPLAVNASQATQMIQRAKDNGLFLMEAMWTRHLPVWTHIQQLIGEGLIGEVRLLTADFSFLSNTDDPAHRRYNPDLAGGALLDIGIYPLTAAYMVFNQEPVSIQSSFHPFHTGVDETSAYMFTYENGAIALLSASFAGHGSKEAVIVGTKGTIRVPLFWKAQELFLEIEGQEPQHLTFPYRATGLQFQAQNMMDCLANHQIESEVMPWRETLRVMYMMDRLRKDWGLVYPIE